MTIQPAALGFLPFNVEAAGEQGAVGYVDVAGGLVDGVALANGVEQPGPDHGEPRGVLLIEADADGSVARQLGGEGNHKARPEAREPVTHAPRYTQTEHGGDFQDFTGLYPHLVENTEEDKDHD